MFSHRKLTRFFKKKTRQHLFQQQDTAHYFAHDGHQIVGGWLSPFSLAAIKLISDFQLKEDIEGNIAEIGVFHGRFFIGLSLLLTSEERAIAIDVFDLQEFNLDNSGKGDYKIFTENIKKFIPEPNTVTTLKQDSLTVTPADVTNKTGNNKKIRIFSVDGCHTAGHTESDMALARDVLSKGGVIIVDDFRNPDWPEIEPGVKNFLHKSPSIKPFAFFYNKLYLTDTDHYQQYVDYFESFTKKRAASVEWMELEGTKVIMAVPPPPEQCFADSFAAYTDYSAPDVKKYLKNGWFDIEPWGVWSDGTTEATVTVTPPPVPNNTNLIMHISLHAFVIPEKPTAAIDLFVNSEKMDTITFTYGKEDYINWKFDIPATLICKPEWTVSFRVPEAKSPKEVGASADPRVLGIGLRSIYFTVINSHDNKR